MNDKAHSFDDSVPAGRPPLRASELPGFRAFEARLEADLERLVERWSHWAVFGTDRRFDRRASDAEPRKPR